MKLSEAILAGSQKRPSTQAGWFATQNGEWMTCAIGAAMEAFGLVVFDGDLRFPGCQTGHKGVDRITGKQTDNCVLPPPWFSEMLNIQTNYPCPCGGQGTFFKIIQHLHDLHGWSREATALWVETVERQLNQPPLSPEGEGVLLTAASEPETRLV